MLLLLIDITSSFKGIKIQTDCVILHFEEGVLVKHYPRVHRAFQNQDQDQAQVKNYFTFFLNQL